jgi:hypothetical protein
MRLCEAGRGLKPVSAVWLAIESSTQHNRRMKTGSSRVWVVLLLIAAAGCSGKSDPTAAIDYSASAAPEPSSGKPPWPRPDDTITLARRAGIVPDRKEYLAYHIHAHLDVFVNGRAVTVPAALGIDVRDPGVKTFKEPGKATGYGGIKRCEEACIAPLHTHDESGVVHIEAPKRADYRLGQFFELWNVRLTRSCVGSYCRPRAPIAVFVGGRRLRTDPADLVFEDGQEIAVVIGSPPETIPEDFEGE